jgi:ankyrin repeat protein
LPLVRKLLAPALGVALDRETARGHTALTWACVCGNLDVVTALLDAGAQLTACTRKTGRTALHMAAAALCAPVVQVLLDR